MDAFARPLALSFVENCALTRISLVCIVHAEVVVSGTHREPPSERSETTPFKGDAPCGIAFVFYKNKGPVRTRPQNSDAVSDYTAYCDTSIATMVACLPA